MGWEIRRRLATGKIQLQSDTGELLNLTDQELLGRWMSQEWIIDESSLGTLANALYLAIPRDLGTYPENLQREAKRRKCYLDAIDPERTPYNPDRWSRIIAQIAEQLEDRSPPCPATVQAWWRRYRQTKSLIYLIPHSKPVNNPHLKTAYQVFEEVISTVYLSNQKLPKQVVFDELRRRMTLVNQGLSQNDQIKCPCRATSYRWLAALQQDIVDASREGAEAARMKYRASIGSVKVNNVLERIEIDHTPLDLIVIDILTKLPLGRPWLTMGCGWWTSADPVASP